MSDDEQLKTSATQVEDLQILPIRRLDKSLTNTVANKIRKKMLDLKQDNKIVDAIDVLNDAEDNVELYVTDLSQVASGKDVAQMAIHDALARAEDAYWQPEMPPIVRTVLDQARQMLLHALAALEVDGETVELHKIVSTVHLALERLPVGEKSIRSRIVAKLLRATYAIKKNPECRQSCIEHLATMIPQVAGESLTLEDSALTRVFDAPDEGARIEAINAVLQKFELLVEYETLIGYVQRCKRELGLSRVVRPKADSLTGKQP